MMIQFKCNANLLADIRMKFNNIAEKKDGHGKVM